MKTSLELKGRWWYRLLEVVFFTLLIGGSILAFTFTYWLKGPQTIVDHKISCNFGNKSEFYAFRDKGITTDPWDPSATTEQLQIACGISYAEAMSLLEKSWDTEAAGEEDTQPALFDSSIVDYKGGNSTATGIFWGLLAVLLTAAFFEVIRRNFNYVVFGSFRLRE